MTPRSVLALSVAKLGASLAAVALFGVMRVCIQYLMLSKPEPWNRAVHDTNGGAWGVQRFINLEARHPLEHLAEIRVIRAARGR